MRISVLCSDVNHPVYPRLRTWCDARRGTHDVELVHRVADLAGGDLLFLVSCAEIVRRPVRERYRATLVIHASDLPQGRGWSPLVWQVSEGKNEIVVTLLEAEDAVDSGAIWHQVVLSLAGHELVDEIHDALFAAELTLMDFAVENLEQIEPRAQDGRSPTYYRRRTPEDSRVDPERSIAEQFDLLRIADPLRYPAFFDYRGQRYEIHLKKSGRRDET